jgi:RNA polymerase sigma-B factor
LSVKSQPPFEPASRRSTAELWELRQSDPAARAELIRRNLPLAASLANRYRNPNEPLQDLVQVASLGLVKAVDRFDPTFGRPFSAYATPTILGELRRHFRDTGWSLHVPRGAQELALRVSKAAAQLTDRSGHSPTIDELAVYLEMSTEDVLLGLDAAEAHFAASLDAPLGSADNGEDDVTTLLDHTPSHDDRYSLVETRTSLDAGIRRLPEAERRALVLRLGEDLSQSEIAARLGCSQMQVSRLLRRAAEMLRVQVDPSASNHGRSNDDN